MGLFGGNKEEINVKLLQGQIKAVCAKSFAGAGGGAEVRIEGDTCVVGYYYGVSNLYSSLGMSSTVVISVTRYGSMEVYLGFGKEMKEKEQAFPRIENVMNEKGYQVYTKCAESTFDRASITVILDGSNSTNWKENLTKMLNDIAINVIRPLTHI